MDKWKNKIAVVTGASSGIGASIVKNFANSEIITIGLARRLARLEQIKTDLGENGLKYMHCFECDISDEVKVNETFALVENNFGPVNILVNNAGIMRHRLLLSDDESNADIKDTIATNLLGLTYCTRALYRQLKKSDDYGYIININSVFGHSVPVFPRDVPPPYNIYPATKHGVTATTEVLRQELTYLKSNKIRVTSISPGLVKTEIMDNAANETNLRILNLPHLQPDDIYESVKYVLSSPYHVNIKEIIIKPVGEQA